MNGDSIVVSKVLFEQVLKENETLKEKLRAYEGKLSSKPMPGQISIDEYTKTLSLSMKTSKQNKNLKGGS